MANYTGTWRTNYFLVHDIPAFRKEFEARYGSLIEIVESPVSHPGHIALLCGKGSDSGAIPTTLDTDDESNEEGYIEVDLPAEVSKHLLEGSVAVFQETGAEKLRYVIGYAIAVDHTGEKVHIDIAEIYDKAAQAFGVARGLITSAEY